MSEDINLIIKNGKTRLENGAAVDHAHDHSHEAVAPANFIPLTAVARHNAAESAVSKPQLDLAAVREKLAQGKGKGYWRSLEELAGREDFHALMEREFPHTAPRDMTPLSRREFVRLMGASMALAGLAGCAFQPAEKILPYVEQPENLIPGKPLFYATAMTLGGYGIGVLAESHSGRPVKLEGNPQHPGSLGATDTWIQASLLGLYDPERSQNVLRRGENSAWDIFNGELNIAIQKQRAKRGAGLRILTETVTSPTLAAQLAQLLALYPEARWIQYEPVTRDNVREGARLAFGEVVHTVYDFSKADKVLALDANFFQEEPGRLIYARDFMEKRRAEKTTSTKRMNRLYAVESMPTITGAAADNRLPMRASDVEAFARALGAALGVPGVSGEAPQAGAGKDKEDVGKWIDTLAKDLTPGASLVIAGAHQPPVVHAIVHAINARLGNVGKSVVYTAPVEAKPENQTESLKTLAADMNAGKVDVLLNLGVNPAYNAPADLEFAKALEALSRDRTKFTAHLGLYFDETGALCQWHVPEAHYLETWGDTRAYDGTIAVQQPLIVPLYNDARSVLEVISTILAPNRTGAIQTGASGYEQVRGYWASRHGGDFDKFWNKCIHDGIVSGTRQRSRTASLRSDFAAPTSKAAGKFEIVFRTDPAVWDGRFANNAWLQELPRPLTKLVWDNAAHISPATAEELGVHEGDLLSLNVGGRTKQLPAWIIPGHPDHSVTVHLGYGRTHGGNVAKGEEGGGVGFDVYALRASDAMDIAQGEVSKAGGSYKLVATQEHHLIDGSAPALKAGQIDTLAGRSTDILRSATLMEFASGAYPEKKHHHDYSMYPPQWPSDISTQNQSAEAGAKPHNGEHEEGKPEGGAHGGSHGGGHGDDHGPVKHSAEYLGEGKFDADGIDRSHSQKVDQVVPQRFEKAENYAQHQWGMSIDLTACIGCNACTIACQAENNIATVGKTMVAMNREMHWLRIDTYYKGSLENPTAYFQPMMCQHCEKAPCEPVCPVEATTHSAEGINEMTYNRCVGTKYCSNNCPYKVRRFNFLQWSDQQTPTIKMMRNPDVTVRSRGVMEKCTFCVQRVNAARIQAEREERPVKEGEVKTACQQTCPTNAIVFGNLIQKGSAVRELRGNPLTYSVLSELSTHPRVTYLSQLRNPHPDLVSAEAASEAPSH